MTHLLKLGVQLLDADAVAFASRALDEASVAFKWHKVLFFRRC
jgi:hypothetical protein